MGVPGFGAPRLPLPTIGSGVVGVPRAGVPQPARLLGFPQVSTQPLGTGLGQGLFTSAPPGLPQVPSGPSGSAPVSGLSVLDQQWLARLIQGSLVVPPPTGGPTQPLQPPPGFPGLHPGPGGSGLASLGVPTAPGPLYPATRHPVPVPDPIPSVGWESAAWHPRAPATVPPSFVEAGTARSERLSYGDLLAAMLPAIQAPDLLRADVVAPDPCRLMSGLQSQSPVGHRSVALDQARLNQLTEVLHRPVMRRKLVNPNSQFRMAPEQSPLFVAPLVDQPLQALLSSGSGNLTRVQFEQHLRVLRALYEASMSQYRLSYHGTIMARALRASLSAPSRDQVVMLDFQVKALLESMDTAAHSAASIVASMRQLLLQYVGHTGSLSASAPSHLLNLPFEGRELFGSGLQQNLEESARVNQLSSQLRSESRSSASASRSASGPAGPRLKRRKPSQPPPPQPSQSFRSSKGSGGQGSSRHPRRGGGGGRGHRR